MVRLQDQQRLKNAVNARTKELMAQIREREKSELLQESLYRISELTTDIELDIDNIKQNSGNEIQQLRLSVARMNQSIRLAISRLRKKKE